MKTLNTLTPAAQGKVLCITAAPPMRRRLQDLGLIHGTTVTCVFTGRHKDISIYKICGALIAIRDCDAASVQLREEETDAKAL